MFDISLFGLSLSEAIEILQPLAMFMIGMAVYSLFIFKFYKFISRRDVFGEKVKQGREVSTGTRIFEYLFLAHR